MLNTVTKTVSTNNGSSPNFKSRNSQPPQNVQSLLSSNYYKTTKYIQEHEILNRAMLDTGTGFLPVFVIELVGRNWQTAIETAFGNVLRILTNYVAPLLLVPFWNKIAARKNNLSNETTEIFKVQFEDLTPETSIQTFKEKLLENHQEPDKQKINNMSEDELKLLKQKLVNAKSFVRKLDLMSIGFLTYISPWIRNWFTRNALKVTGYPGELDLLNESEIEQSTSFHKKFGVLKFASGLVPLVWGTNWNVKEFQKAVSLPKKETEKNWLLNYMRNNIQSFDYHEGYITKRANIFCHNLYGGITSRLLASRSINEIIERVIMMVVSLTGNFWGDLLAHNTFATQYDRKFGTRITSQKSDELDSKKVKPLSTLEKELSEAVKKKDIVGINTLLQSIKAQIKTYYLSMSLTGVIMALVTGFRIWNTRRRVNKGEY